ncbi:toxin-antitoxin system HicB family antitoxin [Secundilactobacillus yichangensis]|uniref:toxin-antitoxin system HicB family antitoxin n=1 Tax=Secundilactobacillus yichangensis TaxID=2799580 RepID=UPI001943FCC6|nr:toxin-antitoxin system HicB family antitoxin [Secundilactobacillus yichangensis]
MKDLDYYMTLAYSATLETLEEDGDRYFRLTIPILPGLEAYGDTLTEAYEDLEEAKKEWFLECLDEGITIPEPVLAHDYSGRMTVRMPRTLHQVLSDDALKEGVSLNNYVVTLLSQNSSIRTTESVTKQFLSGLNGFITHPFLNNINSDHRGSSYRLPVKAEEYSLDSVSTINPVIQDLLGGR